MDASDWGKLFGYALVLVLAIIFMPLAELWGLNTLFGFAFAYTLKNWAAMICVSWIFKGKVASYKSATE